MRIFRCLSTSQRLRGKKESAAFDVGRITSDGGVMLLAQAERRQAIADQHGSSPRSNECCTVAVFQRG
jgi:hypothetical protein